ncbi:hypothetical protein TNCV_2808541 [Trichonephila clavipes]|nr:hypothetical protein TNCV_2808541 [Trichonephila clavipes]
MREDACVRTCQPDYIWSEKLKDFGIADVAAISSRQTIVNKYLQNNKGVNWNGLTVDDFVFVVFVVGFAVVVCVAGFVVEACVVHQS